MPSLNFILPQRLRGNCHYRGRKLLKFLKLESFAGLLGPGRRTAAAKDANLVSRKHRLSLGPENLSTVKTKGTDFVEVEKKMLQRHIVRPSGIVKSLFDLLE